MLDKKNSINHLQGSTQMPLLDTRCQTYCLAIQLLVLGKLIKDTATEIQLKNSKLFKLQFHRILFSS